MKELTKSLAKAIKKVNEKELKKTGKSKLNYEYFQLGDFISIINEALAEENLIALFKVNKKEEEATLTITNGENEITYNMPTGSLKLPASKINIQSEAQHIGGVTSYIKKMLYITAFGIAENETVDQPADEELKGKF